MSNYDEIIQSLKNNPSYARYRINALEKDVEYLKSIAQSCWPDRMDIIGKDHKTLATIYGKNAQNCRKLTEILAIIEDWYMTEYSNTFYVKELLDKLSDKFLSLGVKKLPDQNTFISNNIIPTNTPPTSLEILVNRIRNMERDLNHFISSDYFKQFNFIISNEIKLSKINLS